MLGPIPKERGNPGARATLARRVTLALPYFFFFFTRRVYKAGRVTLARARVTLPWC